MCAHRVNSNIMILLKREWLNEFCSLYIEANRYLFKRSVLVPPVCPADPVMEVHYKLNIVPVEFRCFFKSSFRRPPWPLGATLFWKTFELAFSSGSRPWPIFVTRLFAGWPFIPTLISRIRRWVLFGHVQLNGGVICVIEMFVHCAVPVCGAARRRRCSQRSWRSADLIPTDIHKNSHKSRQLPRIKFDLVWKMLAKINTKFFYITIKVLRIVVLLILRFSDIFYYYFFLHPIFSNLRQKRLKYCLFWRVFKYEVKKYLRSKCS